MTVITVAAALARPFPKVRWEKRHCVWQWRRTIADFATRQEAETFCRDCLDERDGWSISLDWVKYEDA